MEIGAIKGQGTRTHMEDFCTLHKNFLGDESIFAAICDGHGGDWPAHHTAQNIAYYFKSEIAKGAKSRDAFIRTYKELSRQVELKCPSAGTVVVSFFLKDRILYHANAGDAHLMIIGENNFCQLTEDHRVLSPKETRRIIKNGGYIHKCYAHVNEDCGLMPTRTIGDAMFKKIGVIATPHTGTYHLKKNDFMLVAGSDGLFDELEQKEIASLAHEHRNPYVFLTSIKHELDRRNVGDNYCVIAAALK